MNNAEKFKKVFGIYATELLAMPEEDFLRWLNGLNEEAEGLTEDRWIPVTERLPEVKQRVLAQRKDGFMEVKVCIDGGHLAWFYSGIVAWRPLPEPYTEEKE